MGKNQRNRRRKQNKAKGMPALSPVPKRDKKGCYVDRTRQQSDPDPQQTVREARQRHSGQTEDWSKAALAEPSGQAIYAVKSKENADALWAIFKDMTNALWRYDRVVLGKSSFAKTAKLEMMPEPFSTEGSEHIDTRSEEEKIYAATNSRQRWHGYIGHLTSSDQSSIFDAIYGRAEIMSQGKPTQAGLRFVAAMDLLARVVKRCV